MIEIQTLGWQTHDMNGTIQIDQLTRREKLMMMEAIWADLAKDESALESPRWHSVALKETESRFKAGKERAIDLSEAKRILRKHR